jgi:hypothetical protein
VALRSVPPLFSAVSLPVMMVAFIPAPCIVMCGLVLGMITFSLKTVHKYRNFPLKLRQHFATTDRQGEEVLPSQATATFSQQSMEKVKK